MMNIYADFVEKFMAIPVIKGLKTESERFAGAEETYCIEALMQDGKALQMGTSHFLGQNFAKASNIEFLNKEGQLQHAWTTSWGVSTRLIGGLIMVHSRKLFDRWDSFKRFAPLMPVVSAVAVLLLGVTLTYGAAARFMSEFNFSITYPTLEKAQIVYLADDQNKHQQLFLADANGENPKMITQTSLVITDYALSPDQTRLIYFLQTKNIDNEIWLINIVINMYARTES